MQNRPSIQKTNQTNSMVPHWHHRSVRVKMCLQNVGCWLRCSFPSVIILAPGFLWLLDCILVLLDCIR